MVSLRNRDIPFSLTRKFGTVPETNPAGADRLNPNARRRFDEHLEWVLERLPPMIHELIERVPLHVEDYPSEEVMERTGVEYIDDLCGLYTGIPIGEKSVRHSGTLPDVVTIYREGILSAAADRARPDFRPNGCASRFASPSSTNWPIIMD